MGIQETSRDRLLRGSHNIQRVADSFCRRTILVCRSDSRPEVPSYQKHWGSRQSLGGCPRTQGWTYPHAMKAVSGADGEEPSDRHRVYEEFCSVCLDQTYPEEQLGYMERFEADYNIGTGMDWETAPEAERTWGCRDMGKTWCILCLVGR